jgi:hypothetical protein
MLDFILNFVQKYELGVLTPSLFSAFGFGIAGCIGLSILIVQILKKKATAIMDVVDEIESEVDEDKYSTFKEKIDSIWKKINSLVCKTNTLNDNDLESVQIYPNPVNDILHIQHSQSNFKLKLSDISGKVIIEYKNVNQIDISNLEKGIYLLELENEGNLKSVRVIKN